MVETDKMVHVGVGYESMTYFEKVFGRQAIEVAKIKDESAFLEEKGDEKTGIIKGTVD
jgi:hypothetical protein